MSLNCVPASGKLGRLLRTFANNLDHNEAHQNILTTFLNILYPNQRGPLGAL